MSLTKHYQNKGNYYSALICKNKISKSMILLDADIILPRNVSSEFINNKKKFNDGKSKKIFIIKMILLSI